MKIAVISDQSTQIGLSSFVTVLGSFFSRTQQQRVALLTTGNIDDILSINDVNREKSILNGTNTYRAAVLSDAISDEGIWDYGYRIGKEALYAFDNPSQSISQDEMISTFIQTMNRIKSQMVLIEVVGDINDPMNKAVIENADMQFYAFTQSPKSIANAKAYRAFAKDHKFKNMVGLVCLKYDRNICAEKAIATALGENMDEVTIFPYNPAIASESLKGTLNTLTAKIVEGHPAVLNLRQRLLEICQYLYDTSSHKVIKGVKEWSI